MIVNAAQCTAHLDGPKRAECLECIRGRGKFHTQGHDAPGVCRDLPHPPPPREVHHRVPPLPASVLERPEQCDAIHRHPKRERCRRCLDGRNWYFTQGGGWGYCKPRPAPPPPKLAPVVTGPEQCDLIRRAPKRERCHACVRRGGHFFVQGVRWGYCKVRRVPPPPPPPRKELRRERREHRKELREDRRDRRKHRREDRRDRRKDRRKDRRGH